MIESPLKGARIALTGARKLDETADFVRRLGGVPILAPSLNTAYFVDQTSTPEVVTSSDPPSSADLSSQLQRILSDDVALFVFLTGVGARALFRLAEAEGKLDPLRAALAQALVVARGPKALGALKGAGVRVDWLPKAATVEAIIAGLDPFTIEGRTAVVLLSGFADDRLDRFLAERGMTVLTLDLYRHLAPADEAPVLALLDLIRDGGVDFVTFTSAIAVRAFFAVAERHARDDEAIAALKRGPVVPVAVGSVTAAALAEAGTPARIVPEMHTTGGMLRAIEGWLTTHPRGSRF